MQTIQVDGVSLHYETAEAGTRYLAPVLILPGLFQSTECWSGITSMLAHRGWDVYILPRDAGAGDAADQVGWDSTIDRAARAITGLGGSVIVIGADLGAAIALSLPDEARPLALGLFAPTNPDALAAAYTNSLGFLARRRERRASGPVAAPGPIASTAREARFMQPESRALLDDIQAGVGFSPPATHPPAIVFAPDADPLVATEEAAGFARNDYSKPARSRLRGRFWPTSGWEPACDDFHRFLILTLSDRVVEFPDEIIND